MAENITRQHYKITRQQRMALLQQKPVIIWLTGLSGSGKSTIADLLEQRLFSEGYKTYLLDGDNVRHGLNKDVDFSEEGRKENIRRIGEVARLFLDAGLIVITAFISPFRSDRDAVRKLAGDAFIEVFVNCPVEVCAARDVKGLYAKAMKGEIKDFTGVNSPFEIPENPEVEVQTDIMDTEECINKILSVTYKRIKV